MVGNEKLPDVVEGDVIVIGGGIVGASCAWALSSECNVVLLESENEFGYHSTGRSAALYSEYFGDPVTKMLTKASRRFLQENTDELPGGPFLRRRGTLALTTSEQIETGEVATTLLDHKKRGLPAELVSLYQVRALFPIANNLDYHSAIFRPDTWDIDVAELLASFLRVARSQNAVLCASAKIERLTFDKNVWSAVGTAHGVKKEWRAPIIVNAAGAWADVVARLAGITQIGLEPRRRTIVFTDLPQTKICDNPTDWPMLNDFADTFYFKPETGGLILCPCDATLIPACDVQPEDLDVAIAVNQFENITGIQVRRIKSKWSGLRTFSPDGKPVIGQDTNCDSFFWAAGLGGAGIQSAPGVGLSVASLITSGRLPTSLRNLSLTSREMAPRAKNKCPE